MSAFLRQLKSLNPDAGTNRTWLYVPYDQLTDTIGPLARRTPDDLGIVLIENRWKASRRPYHKQKLALVLANMRHFALEQASRGVRVEYRFADSTYAEALTDVVKELGPLLMMNPAERELRTDLQALVVAGELRLQPHEGWLTTKEDFLAGAGAEPVWRMDAFYRHVRRNTGILMDERGKPVGGRFSFDGENRKPWPGTPAAPEVPSFTPDAITAEVIELVETTFQHHPGSVRPEQLPTTKEDAERLWQWALDECLPLFGPYEDAMSTKSRGLFHTRISPLMNMHRLLPRRILEDVLAADIPLPSLEGFVRQILGWREYVRHIHTLTDGFRELPGQDVTTTPEPGDAGFALWSKTTFPTSYAAHVDGGATPNRQGQNNPVFPAFWGAPSGLKCLDDVVESVWDEGYSHHITRLMVLANMGMLFDISPRALTDWFWVAYIDAYDWVVEPNVLGMGMYATDCMTTKPYIAGSGYIRKMSDYCKDCEFHPKKSCPLTPMYWAWLDRHAESVSHLQRMRIPLASLRKRSPEKRESDLKIFETVTHTLLNGERLSHEQIAPLLP